MVGIGLGLLLGTMMNYFMAGPDVVSWDLLALGRAGPYQLVVHHAHGAIVEYFADLTASKASALDPPPPTVKIVVSCLSGCFNTPQHVAINPGERAHAAAVYNGADPGRPKWKSRIRPHDDRARSP